jgi:hypothetical protein
MSQPAAPSHESLPETYVDRNDAIKAIRGFAKSTGHQIVLSNRCPKGITFRCKGYKTPGAETFECEFKVCVFRKTVDGITSSSWTLNHRSQTWEHTCPVAGSASGRPTAQRVLTPSMALASAIAAPGSRVQSGATSGTTPRPMDDTSSSTEYVPMGMQVGFTRPTMVALQSSAAAASNRAPGMLQLGDDSTHPSNVRVTPSIAHAGAVAAPGTKLTQNVGTYVQSGATSGTTPRPMVDTSSSTEYVPMGMQVGFTRPTMVALQSSAAAAPIEAPGTTPHPHNGVRKLHNGKYECCFCIAGSGKAQGHGGRHKKHANKSKGQKQRRKNKVLELHHRGTESESLSLAVCANVAVVVAPPNPRKAEAIELLPSRFENRSDAADAMRRFGTTIGMTIHQTKGQNGTWVTWRCTNQNKCGCAFKVVMSRPMCKGVFQPYWVLKHDQCIWEHALACYQAPTPLALDVAKNNQAVRDHITAFRTLGCATEKLDVIKSFLEQQGVQIPRQSGNQTAQSARDQQLRFCKRICERVLGYDDEGLSQSLRKLDPWCTAFRDGGNGDAHLEIRGGEFVGVVITWHTSTYIVEECGFRVVALDAATFEYQRKDLRLFIIVGYTSNNTLMPLAMMIAFNEDLEAYRFFFSTLKGFRLGARLDSGSSVLWTFLDHPETSVIADQGPLRCTRKAFNEYFEHAELRSCTRHIIGNCLKRAHSLTSTEQGLLFDLVKCPNELGVNELLKKIESLSPKLHNYILADDLYTHWVRFYLRPTFDAGKDTSNGAEQFFSAARRRGFRQLRPLDALIEITKYTGERQQEFFNMAARRLTQLGSMAMTEYLAKEYEQEKKKATTLSMAGVPHSRLFNCNHLITCLDQQPSQGYSSSEANPHAGYVQPTHVTVRFEQQQPGSPISVTCSSIRCNTWIAKGYACRHCIVVGNHNFPEHGRLIERDSGNWWLRHMIRKEYRCSTISDLQGFTSATTSPPTPDDTTASPPVRMPIFLSDNRSDRKAGRYRGFNEASNKGRAPPKRKERDSVAEAAKDLVLQLDESDCCLVVVYNQKTNATFSDGSSTAGRARPVRVIRAGPTQETQPRLIATVYCYLSKKEKDFLIEHIGFAAVITEHVAKNEACTGTWLHPEEPASRRAQSASQAAAAAAVSGGQPLILAPDRAQHLISEAQCGKYFMVVYVQQSQARTPSKKRPATVYADDTRTDGVRPRPIKLVAHYEQRVSVMCCLSDPSDDRRTFSLKGLQWAQEVDRSVAEGEGCSGSWTPARASNRLRTKRHRGSNTAAAAATGTVPSASRQASTTGVTATHGNATAASQHPKKPGVTWIKQSKNWRARVEHEGIRYNLGFYTSWEDAATAVDEKREALRQQAHGS